MVTISTEKMCCLNCSERKMWLEEERSLSEIGGKKMAKEGEREKHKCSQQMERRRHTDENMSCWLQDRREQRERWG